MTCTYAFNGIGVQSDFSIRQCLSVYTCMSQQNLNLQRSHGNEDQDLQSRWLLLLLSLNTFTAFLCHGLDLTPCLQQLFTHPPDRYPRSKKHMSV